VIATCFVLLVPVVGGCGARPDPEVRASGTAVAIIESSVAHLNRRAPGSGESGGAAPDYAIDALTLDLRARSVFTPKYRAMDRGTLFSRFPELKPATWDALLEANGTQRKWPSILDGSRVLGAGFRFVTRDPDAAEESINFERLYYVSAPGMSKDGKQALVLAGYSDKGAGRGEWILLRLRGSQWVVVGHVQAWVN